MTGSLKACQRLDIGGKRGVGRGTDTWKETMSVLSPLCHENLWFEPEGYCYYKIIAIFIKILT